AREQHDMTMKEKQFDLRSKQIAAATDQNQVLAANGIVPLPIQIDPIGGEAVLKELAAQRQMFGEFMLEVTKAMTAPKRIIKDQQGRPAGVETIQPQQQGMQ
ncbi:hypothetical protein EN808_34985, partial [Mesorhizobium sp. M8A.F.Ca.ET.165.01.1.1]